MACNFSEGSCVIQKRTVNNFLKGSPIKSLMIGDLISVKLINIIDCQRFGDNNKLETLLRKAVTIKITKMNFEKPKF